MVNTKTCEGCTAYYPDFVKTPHTLMIPCRIISDAYPFYDRRKAIRNCPCSTCITKIMCKTYCHSYLKHYHEHKKFQKRNKNWTINW